MVLIEMTNQVAYAGERRPMLRSPFQNLSLGEIVESWDFIFALVAMVAAFAFCWAYPIGSYGGLVSAYLAMCGGLFAVSVASYAIFTSLTDPKLVVYLSRLKILGGYLDAFLFTAYIAIFGVASTLVLWVVFSSHVSWAWPAWGKSALHALAFFWVAYTVGSAATLVTNITDFFTRRTEFYDKTTGLEQHHIDELLQEVQADMEREELNKSSSGI